MGRKELITALEALEPALRDLEAAIQEGGGGGIGGGIGGGGGGLAGGFARPAGGADPVDLPEDDEGGAGGVGGLLAAGRRHPVVAGLATVAALAGPGISQGLISASRGGSFEAGALSAINQTFAKVPLLGELSGVAGGARIEAAVSGGIANQIAEVEARGGQVSDEFRSFLLEENFEIERRREESRQRSQIEIEQLAAGGATGQPRVTTRALLLGSIGLGGVIVNQLLESSGVELFK